MFFTIQPWSLLMKARVLGRIIGAYRVPGCEGSLTCKARIGLTWQRKMSASATGCHRTLGKSREREVLTIGDEQREFLVEAVSDM